MGPKGDLNPKPLPKEMKSMTKTPIVEISKDLNLIKKSAVTIEKTEVTSSNLLSKNERLAVFDFDKSPEKPEIINKKPRQKITSQKEEYVKNPKQKLKLETEKIVETKQKLT